MKGCTTYFANIKRGSVSSEPHTAIDVSMLRHHDREAPHLLARRNKLCFPRFRRSQPIQMFWDLLDHLVAQELGVVRLGAMVAILNLHDKRCEHKRLGVGYGILAPHNTSFGLNVEQVQLHDIVRHLTKLVGVESLGQYQIVFTPDPTLQASGG